MKLLYAFLADAADVTTDGRFSVFRGGIQEFNCPSTPCVIPSLAIIAKFSIPVDERNSVHQVELEGQRPNHDEFFSKLTGQIDYTNYHANLGMPLYHTHVFNLFGLIVWESGPYRFILKGDDVELETIEVRVDPPHAT